MDVKLEHTSVLLPLLELPDPQESRSGGPQSARGSSLLNNRDADSMPQGIPIFLVCHEAGKQTLKKNTRTLASISTSAPEVA